MAKYPIPVFHFTVSWGGNNVGFSEVSGLTQETQIIEYRDGASPDYHTVKMPGLRKVTNITMKRGVSKGDNEFFIWLNTVNLNTIQRRDLTICLLNEKHEAVITWSIQQAWPVKVEGPSLKASGNEVAVESIELAHEGLTLENS
jgi:phage tail-like protein